MNESESNAISNMRFILSAFIVSMHAAVYLSISDYSSLSIHDVNAENIIGWSMYTVFNCLLFQIAVPSFFFLSGYLFFKNIESLDVIVFTKKIKRRIRTLLIPYLLWNIVFFFLRIIYNLVAKDISVIDTFEMSGWYRFLLDSGVTLERENILHCMMPYGRDPIDGPLWFVRDLLILSLLTPLLYILNKYGRIYCLLLGAICMIFNIWPPFFFLSSIGFFFFWLGSYFQQNNINLFSGNCKYRRLFVYILVSITLIWGVTSHGAGVIIEDISRNIFVIFGVFSMFDYALYLTRNELLTNKLKELSAASFFIYAAHYGLYLGGVTTIVRCAKLPPPPSNGFYPPL